MKENEKLNKNNFDGSNICTDVAFEKNPLITPRQSPDPQFYSYFQKMGKSSNFTPSIEIKTPNNYGVDLEDLASPPPRKSSKIYTSSAFDSIIQSRKEAEESEYFFENNAFIQMHSYSKQKDFR